MSLAKTAIRAISEQDEMVKEAQVVSKPEELVRWIRQQEGTIAAIGVGGGLLSQWLQRGPGAAGLDVVLTEVGG